MKKIPKKLKHHDNYENYEVWETCGCVVVIMFVLLYSGYHGCFSLWQSGVKSWPGQ